MATNTEREYLGRDGAERLVAILKTNYVTKATGWQEIEDKPFGEVPGADTVYWDGHREGLVKADGYDRYMVSTAAPTLADFENGASNTKLMSGTESTSNLGIGTAIYEAGDGCIVVGNTIVALKDGATLGDEVYPKKGTYFTWIGNDSYTTRLTINGYNGFLVTKKIDSKYLPDDICGVPAYASATEGAFLRVINGVPTWSTIPNAEEASF
jgi:hypothetical protein